MSQICRRPDPGCSVIIWECSELPRFGRIRCHQYLSLLIANTPFGQDSVQVAPGRWVVLPAASSSVSLAANRLAHYRVIHKSSCCNRELVLSIQSFLCRDDGSDAYGTYRNAWSKEACVFQVLAGSIGDRARQHRRAITPLAPPHSSAS